VLSSIELVSYIGDIVGNLLTEVDLGTGCGHFESIDYQLKIEAALMLSWHDGS
jgi:hypothetical protein